MHAFIRTKICIPDTPVDFVQRPRLVEYLARGLDRQLTLVVAPAGYGKTSLVAHWLRSFTACDDEGPAADAHLPVWYSLDAEDNDPATFLLYLTQALLRAGFDLDASLLRSLESDPADNDQLIYEFLGECTAAKRHALIVLDDYHLITSPAIHTLVNNLVRYAAHTLHLVLITRADPPLNIARLRAHDAIMEIRMHALRFNRSEADELLQALLHNTVAQPVVDALFAQTEGWAVGLQLSAIAVRERGDVARFVQDIQQHTNLFVIDYLVDEVLAAQPAVVRDFLLATSILKRFNAALAAAVTGLARAEVQQIMAQLQQNNLFVISLDAHKEWMRYHQQFQEMLRHRLSFQLNQSSIHALHEKAGIWLADHDHLDEAIAHFAACQAWDRAVEYYQRVLPALQNAEQFNRLEQWLARFPQAIVNQYPSLLMSRIWLLLVHDALDAVPPLLVHIRRQMTRLDAAAAPNARASAGELDAMLALGIDPALEPAVRLEHAQRALANLPRTSFWARSIAYQAKSLILAGQDDADGAIDALTHTIHACDPHDARLLVRLHTALVQTLLYTGHVHALHPVAQRLLLLAQTYDMRYSMAWANYALAYVAHEEGKLAWAYHLLSPLADRHTTADFFCRVIAIERLITVAAPLGLLPEVIAQIHAQINHHKRRADVQPLMIFDALLAYANLLAGNRVHAANWAQASAAATPFGGRAEQTIRQIQATVLLAQGTRQSVAQAKEIFETLYQAVAATHTVYHMVPLGILLACAYQAFGQRNAALKTLAQAIAIGYSRGYRQTFLAQGPTIARMLHELARGYSGAADVREAARAILSALTTTSILPFPTTTTESQSAAPQSTASQVPAARRRKDDAIEPLSLREEEVLNLLGKRLTNKEIARELGVSPLTVRNHASRLYRKLGVSTRKDAVEQGHLLGLLSDDTRAGPATY